MSDQDPTDDRPPIDAPALHAEHARRWQDRDAAESYRLRPTYPEQVFDILLPLMPAGPRTVLDLGCGTGNIARPLGQRVDRVDAIDLAAPMIEIAKSLPGGIASNIRWQVARAEEADLDPPYAMAVGGESLHWMEARGPDAAARRGAGARRRARGGASPLRAAAMGRPPCRGGRALFHEPVVRAVRHDRGLGAGWVLPAARRAGYGATSCSSSPSRTSSARTTPGAR